MKNIVLIGMPGTGKSTVGKALAERFGYEFVDADDLIVQATGKTLPEILRQDGLEAFYEIENKVGTDLNRTHTVIATGGSAVLNPRGLQKLRELGRLVYLSHPYEEIVRRIPNLATRGITLDPGQYDYRTPIYERVADLTVDASSYTIEQTARAIQQAAGLE